MVNNKSLKHIGVLGMHWGQSKARVLSSDHVQSRELKKKHVSELSNAEITKITTRLQLEKSLASLNTHQVGVGQKIFANLVQKFGPLALGYIVKNYVAPNFRQGMDEEVKKSHFHNDPNVVNAEVVN